MLLEPFHSAINKHHMGYGVCVTQTLSWVDYATIISPIIAVLVALVPIGLEIWREHKKSKSTERVNNTLHYSLIGELESNYRIITKKDSDSKNTHEFVDDETLQEKSPGLSMEVFKYVTCQPEYLHWLEAKHSHSTINELWDYYNDVRKIKEIAKIRLSYRLKNAGTGRQLINPNYRVNKIDIEKYRMMINKLKEN